MDLTSHLTVISIQPTTICYLCFVISTIARLLPHLLWTTTVLSPVCYLDYSHVVTSVVINHKVLSFLDYKGLLSQLLSITKVLSRVCYLDYNEVVT